MANMEMKKRTKVTMVLRKRMILTIVNSNQTNMRSTTYRGATRIVITTKRKMTRNNNIITLMMMLTTIMAKNLINKKVSIIVVTTGKIQTRIIITGLYTNKE